MRRGFGRLFRVGGLFVGGGWEFGRGGKGKGKRGLGLGRGKIGVGIIGFMGCVFGL